MFFSRQFLSFRSWDAYTLALALVLTTALARADFQMEGTPHALRDVAEGSCRPDLERLFWSEVHAPEGKPPSLFVAKTYDTYALLDERSPFSLLQVAVDILSTLPFNATQMLFLDTALAVQQSFDPKQFLCLLPQGCSLKSGKFVAYWRFSAQPTVRPAGTTTAAAVAVTRDWSPFSSLEELYAAASHLGTDVLLDRWVDSCFVTPAPNSSFCQFAKSSPGLEPSLIEIDPLFYYLLHEASEAMVRQIFRQYDRGSTGLEVSLEALLRREFLKLPGAAKFLEDQIPDGEVFAWALRARTDLNLTPRRKASAPLAGDTRAVPR